MISRVDVLFWFILFGFCLHFPSGLTRVQCNACSRTPTYTLMSKCSFFVNSISMPFLLEKNISVVSRSARTVVYLVIFFFMGSKAQGKHWYLYWYKSDKFHYLKWACWGTRNFDHSMLHKLSVQSWSPAFFGVPGKPVIKNNNESKVLISQNVNTTAESLLYLKEIVWKKYVSVVRSSFCTRST